MVEVEEEVIAQQEAARVLSVLRNLHSRPSQCGKPAASSCNNEEMIIMMMICILYMLAMTMMMMTCKTPLESSIAVQALSPVALD